ncbi:pimeloyl-ACP methyl ester carboxylesterase [Chitinophaga dinghuensis]|uniref:Pimeloyl-ACP methyl ester carboxylesterase n=1 Tax=Chitinophaga dinghuensis TaxID=1539050 RepID=A0A327W1K7_9BACT|nr:alpha/beta hydrolase [Chitinophaga dinghuensis]RAJ82260.1 pimeloyl-ACP methyl ester carboxylesterase [Chitinophaga dinghuensis]
MKQSLILLHGLFGGLSNWEGVTAHFQSHYNIHIPPLPIYDDHHQDKLEYLVDFLESYIINNELENVILVGNSLGGHVSILYTHRHPEKVAKLVLTGSSGLYENTSLGSFPKRGNYAYIRERVANIFYDPATATDALVEEVFNTTRDIRKCFGIVKTAKSANRNYVAAQLPEIPTPTLLIWGEDDRVTPPDVAREFHHYLPNATLVMLPECGHAPMMERPAAFNAILEPFLAA